MQNGDTYNRGGMIAFIFSMIFSLGFFVYVGLMHPGIDLKEIPAEAVAAASGGLAEQGAAGAPQDVGQIEKPWEPSEAMVSHGKQVFQMTCAACHGTEGRGDGPAGKALVPPARNLVEGKWKQGGDSISLFKTLVSGVPGGSMAGFPSLPVKDRWALVQFIRSITEAKVEDDAAKLEEFAKSAQ